MSTEMKEPGAGTPGLDRNTNLLEGETIMSNSTVPTWPTSKPGWAVNTPEESVIDFGDTLCTVWVSKNLSPSDHCEVSLQQIDAVEASDGETVVGKPFLEAWLSENGAIHFGSAVEAREAAWALLKAADDFDYLTGAVAFPEPVEQFDAVYSADSGESHQVESMGFSELAVPTESGQDVTLMNDPGEWGLYVDSSGGTLSVADSRKLLQEVVTGLSLAERLNAEVSDGL